MTLQTPLNDNIPETDSHDCSREHGTGGPTQVIEELGRLEINVSPASPAAGPTRARLVQPERLRGEDGSEVVFDPDQDRMSNAITPPRPRLAAKAGEVLAGPSILSREA